MTAQTDWKSLAEEAAMDLDECPVEGCTNLPRHRGRHNKRGLLPSTQAELDEALKKRGPKPGKRPEVRKDISLAPEQQAELEQAVKPRVRVVEPEPIVITLELVVQVRVIP